MGASRDGSAFEDTIDAATDERPRPRRRQKLPADDYVELCEVDPAHYIIGDEIGAGGMGRIFSARDRRFGRPVALKQLRSMSKDARRFEQEARITARLQHPGIVAVYEAGVWPGGEPFYAMRRVDGRSLDEVVVEHTTLQERLALLPHAIAVGDALAYAHNEQIIHRDLKPANVLVGEFGETVIIDWGLAKDLRSAEPTAGVSQKMRAVSNSDTTDGTVLGTPAYMPPEQARGEVVDQRVDVYALGALLYYMMAGEAPYTGGTSREVVDRVIAGPPSSLEERQRGVPADLLAIVEKAMSRDPGDRYPTAAELTADLKRFQTGQLVGAYRYSAVDRVLRFAQRYRAAVVVAVASIGALAVLGAVSVKQIINEREYAEVQRAEAERQRSNASRQTLVLLEEQARQELLAGHAGRALAYLGAAIAGGRDAPVLRLLVAESRRAFEPQIRELRAHAGRVHGVSFSPAGDRILSAGDDGVARLWSKEGSELARLEHRGPIYRATFSRRGDRIATASEDGTAMLWTADGERIARLAHGGPVLDADFDAEGARLITASADGIVRVWSAKTGAPVASLEHGAPVLRAELSYDGRRAVAAATDRVAIVWEIDSGEHRALEHPDAITWAAISTDLGGSRLVTTSVDGVARVWDPSSGALVATLQGHADEVVSAVFRRDDAHILTASRDRTARVWDAASGRLIATLDGHFDAVLWAGYSPDQTRVLTASNDGTMRLWDPITGASLSTFEGHAAGVEVAAFERRGTRIASAGWDGTVRVWTTSGSALRSMVQSRFGQIGAVDFDPSGRRLVTGSSDKTARLWDVASGEPIEILVESDTTIFSVAFSPDGSRVAVGGGDGLAAVHPIGSGGEIELNGHVGNVYAVAFSPDGERLATGGEDGAVKIWDATTGAQLAGGRHEGPVNSVRFAEDGTAVLSASADFRARLWDARSGRALAVIDGGEPLSEAVFRRGGYVLCGPSGAQVLAADGVLLFTLEGAGLVYSAAVSPDDSVIATASADRVVRFWDSKTGKLLFVREAQTDQLLAARFSPGGETLATASRDGTVALWKTEPDTASAGALAELIETRVPWRLSDGRLVPVAPASR